MNNNDLTNWNLREQDLTAANLSGSVLRNVDLTNATITATKFVDTTSLGFTEAQIRSTKSFQDLQLPGVDLSNNDLTGWNLRGLNLSGANLSSSNLSNADLRDTDLTGSDLVNSQVSGADFTGATVGSSLLSGATALGFSESQLRSTASYHAKDLRDVDLSENDLSGWDLQGQNLAGVNFSETNLSNVNLKEANLASATLAGTKLGNTDFSGATVASEETGTQFQKVNDFTMAQLRSTASYVAKDMRGIGFNEMDLIGWDFRDQDLSFASFKSSNLAKTDFANANLQMAAFEDSTLQDADFTGANISNATFSGANSLSSAQLQATANYANKDLGGLYLEQINLGGMDLSEQDFTGSFIRYSSFLGADLTDAVISGVSFEATDLSESQLRTTASYKAKDLSGIQLRYSDLSAWDFSGQDLTDAWFDNSSLKDADFSQAVVAYSSFWNTDLTEAQLQSTTSYQAKNLQGLGLAYLDLSNWDFSGHDLTDSMFSNSNLTNASFQGAVISGVSFGGSNLTESQLRSTASYAEKDLPGILFAELDLTGWDLSGQDLTGSAFWNSNLTGTNLTGAILTGVSLAGVHGLTEDQLRSTASYRNKDLSGMEFANWIDLAGWDLSDQNLSGVFFYQSILTNTNFQGARLFFTSFGTTTSQGFTESQLQSTASYQAKELRGLGLGENDLTDWNFRGQNLQDGYFVGAVLTRTDLREADLRGMTWDGPGLALLTNAIQPDGTMDSLTVASGQHLAIRDDDGVPDPPVVWYAPPRAPLPVQIGGEMTVAEGGTLQLLFDGDSWDSRIAFDAGIPVNLGGTLELVFVADTDLPAQVGRTMQVFDWSGVTPRGAFQVASPYRWDASQLYTTGEVRLLGPMIQGDVDFDNRLTAADIDQLAAALRQADSSTLYDLNVDGLVTTDDHRFWIQSIRKTWFGDANLYGQFTSSDLSDVFQANLYEDAVAGNANWATGDWDGDADFTSSDIVLAFQDGGYEQGLRNAGVAAVPEPATGVLLLAGLVYALPSGRKRKQVA